MHVDVAERKRAVRRRILSVRRALDPQSRASAGVTLREVLLTCPEIAGAGIVAAYAAVGSEPPTRPLLDALWERRVRVLLPVLEPDGDLGWGGYEGPPSLVASQRGLLEPSGPRRGADAVREADVVLVPALAVDTRGLRLGRGGGSYDRALARVGPGVLTVAVLYDGEVVDAVPAEPHDRRVTAAATPSGLHRFG